MLAVGDGRSGLDRVRMAIYEIMALLLDISVKFVSFAFAGFPFQLFYNNNE